MSVRAMKWAYGLFEVIDLPVPERSVLLALCWDHTDKDGCFPSQARISTLSGYRERKVRDILKDLEARGLIKRRRVKVAGKFAHTAYSLFGATTGRRGPVDHRHKKAGRDHRQTGADYRGTNTGDVAPANVIEFPSQISKGAC